MIEGERAVAEFSKLPIDPREVAANEGLEVQGSSKLKGASGFLLRVGENYTIGYSTHWNNRGFENFSIGHELGHFFLPGHLDAIILDGLHESRAATGSKNRFERQADEFAAGLLMPCRLFRPAMNRASQGIRGIEELAELCQTSMVATAIRYTECSRDPVATVVSSKGEVCFSFVSEAFEELPDIAWLRRGARVPQTSAVQDIIRGANRQSCTINLLDWFDTGPDVNLCESAIRLGAYDHVLSFISLEEPFDEEEEEFERSLERSWALPY